MSTNKLSLAFSLFLVFFLQSFIYFPGQTCRRNSLKDAMEQKVQFFFSLFRFLFIFFADYRFLAITLVWHVSITLSCTHFQADTDEGLKILNIWD